MQVTVDTKLRSGMDGYDEVYTVEVGYGDTVVLSNDRRGCPDGISFYGPEAVSRLALQAVGPKVSRVLRNGPATVVFWDDGGKTVVKCRECESCVHDAGFADLPMKQRWAMASQCDRRYDADKGLMSAMLKRLYRNFEDVMRDAGRH